MEFDRSSLISIAPNKSTELGFWSAEITLSIDISAGNTEQLNYSAYANANRRTSKTRFFIDYRGIFDQTQGIETANSQRVNSYLDVFSTRRFFWRPIFAEYFRDPFANIANRGTVGAGVGYHIIDTSVTDLVISPGIAYIGTQYDSTEPDEDETISTPALVVSTGFDTELTDKIDFDLHYKFNIVNQESGTYTHNAKAGLEIELTCVVIPFRYFYRWPLIVTLCGPLEKNNGYRRQSWQQILMAPHQLKPSTRSLPEPLA